MNPRRPGLPSPAGWTEQRIPAWIRVTTGFMAVLALGMAAEAARLAWIGQPGAAVPLAAGAIYLAHAVGMAACIWRSPRRSGRAGELTVAPDATKGMTFAYSAWMYYWVGAVIVMSELVALVLIAVAAAACTVVGVVMAVAVSSIAVVIGWLLVTMLRLAPGGVALSPAGVCHRSLTSTYFVPWDAIAGVSAAWIGAPVIVVTVVPSGGSRLRRYMGRFGSGELRRVRSLPGERRSSPMLVVRTVWLAADPATVYHALSFYRFHPDLRGELATPDAVQRISSGRAVAQEEP